MSIKDVVRTSIVSLVASHVPHHLNLGIVVLEVKAIIIATKVLMRVVVYLSATMMQQLEAIETLKHPEAAVSLIVIILDVIDDQLVFHVPSKEEDLRRKISESLVEVIEDIL